MLTVRPVDERNWPFLRGVFIYTSILKSKEEKLRVTDVQFTPGHIGLSLSRETLCIFDAVPSSLLIKEGEQQRIFQQITKGDITTNIEEVGGDFKNFFVFQIAKGEAPITKFLFVNDEKLNHLRLIVVQENGFVSSWRWIATQQEREVYRWKFISRVQLAEENLVKIKEISYSLVYGTIFWWETDNVETLNDNKKIKTQLMVWKFSDKKRQLPERIRFHKLAFIEEDNKNKKEVTESIVIEREENVNPHGKLVEGFDNISKFIAGYSGLWLITENGLGYWGYGAEVIANTPILSKAEASFVSDEIEEYFVNSDDGRRSASNVLDAILSNKINDGSNSNNNNSNPNDIANNNSNNNNGNGGNEVVDTNLSNTMGMRKVIRKRTSIVGPVIDLFLNYQTHDLMLLESSGRVLICVYATVPKQGILSYHLCTLQENAFDFSDYKAIIAYFHVIVVLTSKSYLTFDIKTGVLISTQNYPDNFTFRIKSEDSSIQLGNVWQSSRDVGFWDFENGIYQLIYPQVAEQLTYMSQNLNSIPPSVPFASKYNYPAAVASHWMLDHFHAKYALDELYLTSKNLSEDVSPKLIEHQQNVSAELLPHLQNPSLVLALLQNVMHRPFLDKQVEIFLERFHGIPASNDQSNAAKRTAQRESYHLHTPLNQALLHLLEQYRNLSNIQKQMGIGKSDKISQLESISPPFLTDVEISLQLLNSGNIWKIERSKFETLLLSHPHHSLDCLEEILCLKYFLYPNNDQNTESLTDEQKKQIEMGEDGEEYLATNHELLTVEEETLVDISPDGKRMNKHPLFPLMCRLYCKVKPSMLLKFVELVQRSWKRGVMLKKIHARGRVRSFYARCISVLPPVLLMPSQSNDALEQERVSACIAVLCKDGQSYRAMRYILQRGLWDKAFELLEEKKGKGLEHNEMFHIALTYCLSHNDVEHCKRVWEYVPENFGVFNLLRLIEQYLVRDKIEDGERVPLTCDPKENLTVGIFQPYFLEMFRTMKNK